MSDHTEAQLPTWTEVGTELCDKLKFAVLWIGHMLIDLCVMVFAIAAQHLVYLLSVQIGATDNEIELCAIKWALFATTMIPVAFYIWWDIKRLWARGHNPRMLE